jgi:4-amino-4-deoxy-L-arabinose transferase-like glycosyltransferase
MPAGNPDVAGRRTAGRRALVAVLALALALRLAFAFGYWVDKNLTRDEREYLSLARSLVAGHGFVYDEAVRSGSVDPFGRAPGYPVFLALVGGGFRVTESVPTSVKIAQAILGTMGVLMVGLLARRLAGDRAGLAAAFIAACYPPLVWISAYAFSEALFWPLGLLIAWQFDGLVAGPGPTAEGPRETLGPRRRALGLALLCGVVTGIAVLVRPAMLFFIPLAGLWLLYKRRLAAVVVFALGTIVVVAPWTIRNYSHYGRFVLVASEGGVTFWTGNHPLARGEGDLAANLELKREQLALRARYPALSEEEMEPIYYREALDWIKAHPFDWILLEARKVFYLVVPIGPSYTVHSPRYYLASMISYGIVLVVAIAGFVRLGRDRGRTQGLWLLAGSAVLVCLVFFPQERFRTPVIDPTLAVLAGALWLKRDDRRQPSVSEASAAHAWGWGPTRVSKDDRRPGERPPRATK